MQKLTSAIPLSLYIHLPWCIRKCPYCDFNSHEARQSLPEEHYVETLLRDLKANLPALHGRSFVSLFFGGGTPSLFSPSAIAAVLEGVNRLVPLEPSVEITLEANPGSVDESRFIGFKHAGINRLSLGIQSLQNEKLKQLGRVHDRESALNAIKSAQMAGFDNMNLDLMHGLPGQSIDDALQDLKDALDFDVPHLSWYQLTIEPNTFFHRHPPSLPAEETLWDIQEQGKLLLAERGFHQYEVSAYSRPGKSCLHNMNYWQFGDYLGIGAGAHSKLTDIDQQIIHRHWQVKNPKDYLDPAKQLTASQKILLQDEILFEFMLNALRLSSGVPIDLFYERTGLPHGVLALPVSQAIEKKLLHSDPLLLKPTELGYQFLNDLVSMFLGSDDATRAPTSSY